MPQARIVRAKPVVVPKIQLSYVRGFVFAEIAKDLERYDVANSPYDAKRVSEITERIVNTLHEMNLINPKVDMS